MKLLTSYQQFVTGTGNSSRSCKAYGVVSAEEFAAMSSSHDYSEIEFLDKSKTVGEQIASGETIYGEYSEVITVAVYPGEFYLGDRRFYLFNNKLSFIATPEYVPAELSSTGSPLWRIKLPDYPDGGSYINYLQPDVPAGIGSPIILEHYSSGELSEHNVILGEPIYSRTGYGGVSGYRRVWEEITIEVSGEVSGEVTYETALVERILEGEAEDMPWVFSPIQPYQVLYTSWRQDTHVVDPTTYYYDYETNSIIFTDSGSLDEKGEYVVSYEVANEPFIIPINLSPKARRPRDGIVCVSAENSDNTIDDIIVSVSPHAYDETAFVRVFALSDRGMEVGGKVVRASLGVTLELYDAASGETLGSETLSFIPLEDTPYGLYNVSGSVLVLSCGVPIADTGRAAVLGYGEGVILPIPGSILPIEDYPLVVSGEYDIIPEASGETNDDGIASFVITPPSHKLALVRTLSVVGEERERGYTETIVPAATIKTAFGSNIPQYTITNIAPEDIVSSGTVLAFRVPDTVLSPSSIRYSGQLRYLQGLWESGAVDSLLYPAETFFCSGDTLWCVAEPGVITESDDVVIMYIEPTLPALGDGRCRYWSDAEV